MNLNSPFIRKYFHKRYKQLLSENNLSVWRRKVKTNCTQPRTWFLHYISQEVPAPYTAANTLKTVSSLCFSAFLCLRITSYLYCFDIPYSQPYRLWPASITCIRHCLCKLTAFAPRSLKTYADIMQTLVTLLGLETRCQWKRTPPICHIISPWFFMEAWSRWQMATKDLLQIFLSRIQWHLLIRIFLINLLCIQEIIKIYPMLYVFNKKIQLYKVSVDELCFFCFIKYANILQ